MKYCTFTVYILCLHSIKITFPDLEIVGKCYWDIKTPTSSSRQVIYRNIRGKENQSNQFAFDLEYSPISYEDVTQEWLDKINYSNVGKVTELDYFEKDGIRYDSNNSKLDMRFGNDEVEIANLLSKKFKEDVYLVPRAAPIDTGQYVSSPDLMWRNSFWDLKTIKGSGKETIINRVKGGKKQANSFIINIDAKSNLTEGMIQDQINYLYRNKRFDYVDKLLVVKDGEILRITKKEK